MTSLAHLPTTLLALAAALALTSVPATAQVEATPALEGRVVLGEAAGGGAPTGVDAETVVLHRVGPDTAGAVDSVRAAPDGAFSFRLPTVPDPGGRGDVYFASVEHQGIMYFGDAITTAVQLDSLYRIEVHDTTAAPPGGARLPLAIRYVVMEPGGAEAGVAEVPEGSWRVTDLIQVVNEGSRTLVPTGEEPVWTYPLPPGALDAQVGAGDTGPDVTRVEDGRLVVFAPLPPGRRQFIVRYTLSSPEVSFTLPGETRSAELLVREPAPPLSVGGLEAAEPVDMGTGTTYRRFAATGLDDARITVEPGEEGGAWPIEASPRWIAVLLALLLGGVGVWAALRRGGTGGSRGAPGAPVTGEDAAGAEGLPSDARNALLLEVARIDERLESGVDPKEEAALRARRSELVTRLRTDR